MILQVVSMYVRSNLVEGEGVEFGQDCTAHDRKGQSIMMIVLRVL